MGDYAGGISDLDAASLLEPKNGEWPLKRSWVRYSAGDWRGKDRDLKIAAQIDRDFAKYKIINNDSLPANINRKFFKSVATKPSYVRFQQNEWEDNPLVGYWFRYEYIDTDAKVNVRLSALSYRLNAFSNTSLEICDLNKNMPCRPIPTSSCDDSEKCENVQRYVPYGGPIFKIFSNPDLKQILHSVPLQFKQWDTDGPRSSNKIYTPGIGGDLKGPYRPDEIEILVDPTFKHPYAERVVAVRRFIGNFYAIEPTYGYLEKKRLLEKTIYSDDRPGALVIEKVSDPGFKAMAKVASPYNAISPQSDLRRTVMSGTNSLFGKYAFVRIFSKSGGCSGAVVGDSTTVVTAGHCLHGDTEYDVIYTARDGREIKRKARVIKSPFENREKLANQFGLHPNQQEALYISTDWAILKLDSKFGDDILPIPLADIGKALAPSNKSLTYIVGFPGDIPSNTPTVSACYSPYRNSIDTKVSWASNFNFSVALKISDCVTFNGNSGGSAIVLEDGQPKFLGVLSGGERDTSSNILAGGGCEEFIYDKGVTGKKSIASLFMNSVDKDKLAQASGKNYFEQTFTDFEKYAPGFANMAERTIDLSRALPSHKLVVHYAANTIKEENCSFKDYSAPFKTVKSSFVGVSTWLFNDIQEITGAKYNLSPVIGTTHFGNPKSKFLLHADFRDWLPKKPICLRYEPRAEYMPGHTIDLSVEAVCEVPLAMIEESSNINKSHGLGVAVVSGSLIIFNRKNNAIVSSYEGVIERCFVDSDYFCRLHDSIDLPQ